METTATAEPELLAPAGDARALRAALAAGADAVYFGLERWSARAFAGNFAADSVVDAVGLAHRWHARAYLALNISLKDAEIEPALAALEAPYLAGLDGLIIGDLGFAAHVCREYPELPLHASTQLNPHSSSQLAALARLGFSRAILARELSLAEIAALDTFGLELETFVHGALCYGYSGDCLLASMVGGRSGNRGRCSQACRLRYDLRLAGGVKAGASPREHPAAASRVMSTSDLAAIAVLPELLAAGVKSFKVEGRMKDPAYVGVTTAVYREALDAARVDPAAYAVKQAWLSKLEQSFSRSFTTAHLEGRHYEVRSGGRGGHRGVLVGRVARVDEQRGEVEVKLSQPVAAGDLVYLYTPWGQSEPLRVEEGGEARIILHVREHVAVKDRLFRLSAAESDELARDLVAARRALRPVRLRMCLAGEEGEPARLTVAAFGTTAGAAEVVTVASERPLAPARTVAIDTTRARDALGALGGTPYRLEELELEVADGLFLAVGDLKELRRRAVAALDERRDVVGRRRAGRQAASPQRGAAPGRGGAALPSGVVLVVRPGERPLPAPGVAALCLDLLPGDALADVAAAADRLREADLPVRARLPETLFDVDEAWWRALLGLPWQAVYARHLGVLAALDRAGNPVPCILEYPLQGLNGSAGGVACGLATGPPAAVVASPEASLEEIAMLAAGGTAVEAVVFGRQQVLHTRDQLGRAEGLYVPLGPAKHVHLLLEDAKGYEFPAVADATGTRVFNSRVTNLAPNLADLRGAGVDTFLVTQADLNGEERAGFRAGGLPALAPLASRERSTTGHLFRGVA